MPSSDPSSSPQDAWPSPVAEELQDILPQHEVIDFIGRGGMGAVYKARQKSLNRIVAVKLLSAHPRQGAELDFLGRFKVEAQAMARLSHPNIVAVHDFGESEDGHLYYVMEFVEGTDLAKRLESEGKLPVAEAVRVALSVCDALVCAHGEGVVHRDIKPSNILIGRDGRIKVADFGLAKIDDPSTASLTLSGTSMGSQGYAAPEVFAKAGMADHRADIYSLGVVLYEMLTGDVPRGMFKLPSEKVPGLNTRFDEIICRAMEEDREERFQSIAEFRDAILSVMAKSIPREPGDAPPAPAAPAPEARGAWTGLRIGAAILALVGIVWLGITLIWPDDATSGKDKTAVTSPGEWQNLLGTIDGKEVRSAKWDWTKAGNPDSTSQSRPLQKLPVSSAESCDLRFRVTKTEGEVGYLHFGFRHGEFGGGIVLLDRHGTNPISFVGLAYLDGKAADPDRDWVQRRETPLLPLDEARTILLLIRDEGVAVLLDGTEVYRWTGDWKRLGQYPILYPKSLEEPIFAVGGDQTKYTVHSAEVRRVTGEAGRLLPPAPPSRGDAPPIKETPASRDLLAHLDVKKQTLNGHWKIEKGTLANLYDKGSSTIEFPVEQPVNYDLRVRLTPQSNADGYLAVALRHGSHGGAFVVDDSDAPAAGFGDVDGKNWVDMPEAVKRFTPFMPLGDTYELTLHVRDEGLLVLLNGEPFYRWVGDWSKAKLAGPWVPADRVANPFIGIGCQSDRAVIHAVEFTPVSGAHGAKLPEVSFAAGPAPSTLPPSVPREFRGHRYRFVPGAYTWEEAKVNAVSLGGHLATPTTEEENRWIWSTFSKYLPSRHRDRIETRSWWIGGTFSKKDNAWSWVTGEPFEYTCWSVKPPPPARTPQLRQHDNGGGGELSAWSPVNYSSRCGYVVEWDPVAPPKRGPGIVELLPVVDVKRDAVLGEWSSDGGELVLKAGPIGARGAPRLQLPYQPPDEYDFEMEFTPEEGVNSVQQILSADGRAFAWMLDVKIDGGVKSGFNVIDGVSLKDRKEGTAMRGEFLVNARRHVSTVEVRKSGLRALLDGREVATWRAGASGYQSLDISGNELLRDKLHLGVAAVNRGVRVHRITVREISDAGKWDVGVQPDAVAPEPPGAGPAGGLIDLLAQVDLKRDAVRGHWSIRADGLHVEAGSVATLGAGGLPRLQLPYEPQGEYDFEMEFTPLTGTEHVHQLVSAYGRAFSWAMDVPTGGGVRAGFESIEGKTLNYRQDGLVVRPKLLTNGQKHVSKVEVRKDQVRGYLDGKLLVTWGSGPESFQKLDMPPYLALRDSRHIGLAAQDRALIVHRIEVREHHDAAEAKNSANAPAEEELRSFAAWLFSLPPSADPVHVGPNQIPDLLIDGINRNFRKVAELPAKPLAISRVRIGPLRVDEVSRKQLGVLGRIPRLWDLRIYGAEDARVLDSLRYRTFLGMFIFRGAPEMPALNDQHLVNLARVTNLNSLQLENWRTFTGQGFAHLKVKRSLEALSLNGCPDLTDEGITEVSRFTNLKSLHLTVGAGVTDAGLAKLAKLVRLESLTLNFTDDAVATGSGLEALAALKQLRLLNLEGKFPGAAFSHVGKLASLEALGCIHNSSVTDATLAGLAPLPKLRFLKLTDTGVTGTGFAGFASSGNPMQLGVDDCKITPEGLHTIVSVFPGLESIALSRNVQSTTAEDIARELSLAPKLRWLECGPGFRDADMPEVAKLNQLIGLGLQHSHVTDACIAHLKPLANLAQLHLTGPRITDACIPALKELPGLTSLVLKDTLVTSAAAAELKKALPQCNIVR